MNTPSIRTISEAWPYMPNDTVWKLRVAMKSGKPLSEIDKILEHYGVEVICDVHGRCVAEYSNSGDVYSLTVMNVGGRYRVTTVGDFVETWERSKKVRLS